MRAPFSAAPCRRADVARPGRIPLVVLALLAVAAWLVLPGAWRWGTGGGLTLLFAFGLQFYRDPERQAPDGLEESDVLSPADGRVVDVRRDPEGLHISIFLSPIDVHVNRAPLAGRVVALEHLPGRFLAAYDPRASSENERVRVQLETPAGTVTCVQVAGLLARRIENWIRVGQGLGRGERYGMIHFGSRLDLELPARLEPRIRTGDRVRAGQSVIAGRAPG